MLFPSRFLRFVVNYLKNILGRVSRTLREAGARPPPPGTREWGQTSPDVAGGEEPTPPEQQDHEGGEAAGAAANAASWSGSACGDPWQPHAERWRPGPGRCRGVPPPEEGRVSPPAAQQPQSQASGRLRAAVSGPKAPLTSTPTPVASYGQEESVTPMRRESNNWQGTTLELQHFGKRQVKQRKRKILNGETYIQPMRIQNP